jgi:hypothetical protein
VVLGLVVLLGAADQPACPKTASTGRLKIAKAILHVLAGHLAAITKYAGREIKILELLSQLSIPGGIPNLQKTVLMNIPHKILSGGALSFLKVVTMCI